MIPKHKLIKLTLRDGEALLAALLDPPAPDLTLSPRTT